MRKISQIFVALEKLTFTFNQWGQSLKFHTICFHKIFSIFAFQKFQFIIKTILETNINAYIKYEDLFDFEILWQWLFVA